MYHCVKCSDEVNPLRWKLNIHLCLICGEAFAKTVKHTILPMHKSNYQLVYSLEDLVGFNSKGGIVHNRYESKS